VRNNSFCHAIAAAMPLQCAATLQSLTLCHHAASWNAEMRMISGGNTKKDWELHRMVLLVSLDSSSHVIVHVLLLLLLLSWTQAINLTRPSPPPVVYSHKTLMYVASYSEGIFLYDHPHPEDYPSFFNLTIGF